MNKSILSLSIALAFAGSAVAAAPKGPSKAQIKANEAQAARMFAAMLSGPSPKLAELTMFLEQMPKGADLHHHYSGAIYAEHYLDWVGKNDLCVNKFTYRIETERATIDAQKAMKPAERSCLSAADVIKDDFTYREMLQRWSSKDFDNHGAVQPPPDRQFFETFGYFSPVSNSNFSEGLQTLKKRAVAENLSYIETMFKMAPFMQDTAWDAKVMGADDAALDAAFQALMDQLDKDEAFNKRVTDFVGTVSTAAQGIDDAEFTMRYQTYVLRLLQPSQVFSSMVGAFKSAKGSNGLIVGVNIVGAENTNVSMRDYSLHMKMFRFLRKAYPDVKVALHAGELTLGMVPPEGLKFHIDEALAVGGANRIGHGIDLAHESNVIGILKTMREKDIPVEINLTSNGFINGLSGEAHPVTLYRKYGVPFVISTDDAGVTRHNLAREYTLFASRYKPDYAEVKKLSYAGIRYAFLPEADKTRLTKQLDERFAKFEGDLAALASKSAQAKK